MIEINFLFHPWLKSVLFSMKNNKESSFHDLWPAAAKSLCKTTCTNMMDNAQSSPDF